MLASAGCGKSRFTIKHTFMADKLERVYIGAFTDS
jgi:hypothetical protein